MKAFTKQWRYQGQETFLVPSGDKQTRNYDTMAQTTVPPYQHRGQKDWAVAEWNGEPYIQIYQ